MNRLLRISLLCTGVMALVVYLVMAFVFLPSGESGTACTALHIHIVDSTKRQFVQSAALAHLLGAQGLYPVGKELADVQTAAIEQVVSAYPVVRRAECYKTNTGAVCLNVYQRVPKLRVAADENYFVDEDRRIMPSLASVACHVPVVTGRVTRHMAQEEIYDFVCYIERNGFWNAQIEQINVTAGRQIELVPRIGGHLILLGNLEGYEHKLDKLKTFYQEGLNKIGWRAYKEVDLRYRGQIVCRK